jgi:glycosyltransferase involved in cell wall biosynthesis
MSGVPILTIAIPAYNDSEALERTLLSLIQSFLKLPTDDAELIVYDNASDDSTFDLASNLIRVIVNAKTLRQPNNIGFARNLKALASEASGQYIWFIGIGERMAQNFLPEMIEFLKNRAPDWGVLKGYFDFQDVARSVDTGFNEARSTMPNAVPVINHAISLNVFRTELVRRLHLGRGSPYDDYWPHFEILSQYLSSNKEKETSWFYFDKTAVLIAKNKFGAWDFKPQALETFLEWGRVFYRISSELQNSKWIGRRSRDLLGRHFLEFVFMVRKFGTLSRHHVFRKILKAELLNWDTKLIAITISFLPRGVLRMVAALYSMRNYVWRRLKNPA